MSKRVTITHAFGPDNRGDHELLQKLIKIIRLKYGENTIISIFTSFPEKSETIFKDSKLNFYKSIVSLAGEKKNIRNYFEILILILKLIIYYLFKIDFNIDKQTKIKLNVIEESNAIFYCPGGYLYSNKLSYYANIFNGFLLKLNKNRIYFSPMSIGPFYSSFDKFLFKILVRKKDYVFARESFTFNLCNKLKVNNCFLTTDLAWFESQIENYELDIKWKDKFVITIIDWDYNDLGNQQFYKDRYYKSLVDSIKYLYEYSSNKVVLYNQVGSGKGSSNDEKLIYQLLEDYPDLVTYDYEELTPEVLKNRLHYCKGLIASRFHSALFAIQAECPFIALSYQPKAEYILKDLNLSHLSQKISEFEGKYVAKNLINLSYNKADFIQSINEAKYRCEELIKQNFIDRI